jgi:hypothetical protein
VSEREAAKEIGKFMLAALLVLGGLGALAFLGTQVEVGSVTTADRFSSWFTSHAGNHEALWSLTSATIAIVAAVYAWYEFVYKRQDRSDKRAELTLAPSVHGLADDTVLLSATVAVKNAGQSNIALSQSADDRPIFTFYVHPRERLLDQVDKAPSAPVLSAGGDAVEAFPFVGPNLALQHEIIEPDATIYSTVAALYRGRLLDLAWVSAQLTVTDPDANETWTVDAAVSANSAPSTGPAWPLLAANAD